MDRSQGLCPVCLLLDTGLRIGEALGLDMADVDWADGTLVVMGKGRKQRAVPFGFRGEARPAEVAGHTRRDTGARSGLRHTAGG